MTDTKQRKPKQDALECRFTGVIRIPFEAGKKGAHDAASELLETLKRNLGNALSGDALLISSGITFAKPKCGKMDAAPVEKVTPAAPAHEAPATPPATSGTFPDDIPVFLDQRNKGKATA